MEMSVSNINTVDSQVQGNNIANRHVQQNCLTEWSVLNEYSKGLEIPFSK